jgi:hypothetical protein
MNKILLLIIILGYYSALAQTPSSFYENRNTQISYFSKEACNTSDVSSVQQFLQKQLNSNLVLTHTAKNEFSTVYTFTQFKNGIEVYHGFAKVILDNNSRSMMVIYVLFADIPESTSTKTNVCWYYNNNEWVIAIKKIVRNYEGNSLNEIILDENNTIISSKDLTLRSHPLDTTIRVRVFNPDPLTSAHKTYIAPYLDYNDSNVFELNAERVWKNVTCRFYNDSFFLSNKYLLPFKNNMVTSFDPVRRHDSIFDYTRHQHEFEDVMVFYHINMYQNYLNSLGFNIGFQPTLYDAHGQPSDNSMFMPGVGLIFGTGGIDDAEDAEVIIHEYSHSLRENASPSTNTGFERQSLEEGFMDYLSTSYKMSIDSFGWKKWAYWDGNNPAQGWNGRSVASPKIYPQELNGDIYQNGEIWSSAMMRIFLKLGKPITDRLAIQTFYYLTNNLSMTQAAWLVIKADSALYNGIHSDTIQSTFAETHILPWFTGINPVLKNYDQIKLINSLNFMEGKGDLLVCLPSEEKGIYTITNNLQQVIAIKIFYSNSFSLPSGSIKTPGVYYLTVSTSTYTVTRKLIIE